MDERRFPKAILQVRILPGRPEMLTKTAIYRKYANLVDYEEFVKSTLESLHEKFPQAQLQPFSKFKTFLDGLVPKLIHKYMLRGASMKVCSGISPDFAEIATQAGFAVITKVKPGHMVNVVLTTEGPYEVDLSYIQYTCNGYDLSDPDTRDEALDTFRELYKDPFKAIKIEELYKGWITGTSIPRGEYDNLYNPGKDLDQYDMQESEELWPETFDIYKKENK